MEKGAAYKVIRIREIKNINVTIMKIVME